MKKFKKGDYAVCKKTHMINGHEFIKDKSYLILSVDSTTPLYDTKVSTYMISVNDNVEVLREIIKNNMDKETEKERNSPFVFYTDNTSGMKDPPFTSFNDYYYSKIETRKLKLKSINENK